MNRLRATAPFLVSNALSLLGNSVSSVVLPLVLLARTGDALAAGTLALICAFPQVIAGMLGGVLLDRFNRRDLSIVSDAISAASVAALPIIDATVGLSFWWFAACGVAGAIGDIPGMTARDTLLPSVVKHDGLDLQRFMGVAQSADSLVVIAGPAVAALGMGLFGDANALWLTAALSAAAACATAFVPRTVGVPAGVAAGAGGRADAGSRSNASAQPDASAESDASAKQDARTESGAGAGAGAGLVRAALASAAEGVRTLFAHDAVLRTSVVLSLLVSAAIGSFQGMVLPVHFTENGAPELLGYVLSALSAGALAGSLVYAKFAHAFSRRRWYVLSFAGMAAGMAAMGLLASFPLVFAGAAVLGFASGPASALLGFFVYGRIPDAHRGAALGAQNVLVLVTVPAAVFATSVAVGVAGAGATALAIVAVWLGLTVYALFARAMSRI